MGDQNIHLISHGEKTDSIQSSRSLVLVLPPNEDSRLEGKQQRFQLRCRNSSLVVSNMDGQYNQTFLA
jgi:hypothetical protein